MRIVWLVVLSIVTAQAQAAVMETITQTTTGRCSPTISHVDGSVTVVCQEGIPAEQFQHLAEELGVTKAALTSFFKILEQKRVPLEDLDAKLREIAMHYTTVLERVRTLSANDPHIAQVRDAAETAIREGEFDRAEQFLNEASARDLAAAQELQDLLAQRLLAAAEAKATNDTLKKTQLAYAEAANYYRQATKLVEQMPVGSEVHLARFLNDWGVASGNAGDLRDAEGPLQRALTIREAVLGAQHLDVAESLHSLAMLSYVQGRYADAEPRYQRALAILEKLLGPEHPAVATVGKNYAALLRATNRDAEAAQLEARLSLPQPPRAWLGIRMRRSIEPPGLLVEQVIAESSAAHARIQPHDVIIRFNAQEVSDLQTLLLLVGAVAIGTTVDVEIIHDGQRRTIPVILEQRPRP